MVSLRRVTKLAGSEVGFVAESWINSPGSLSVVPYTSSRSSTLEVFFKCRPDA